MCQIATESRKFSALKGIAETNKKGRRTSKRIYQFDVNLVAYHRPRESILGFS